MWLCAPQAKQIWNCLAENAVFTVDRESCFKWFSKLMGEDPDLDPDINREFFEHNILMLDPTFLTEHGMRYVLIFAILLLKLLYKLIINRISMFPY